MKKNKSKTISFKITDDEHILLANLLDKTGMTQSEYLRNAALNNNKLYILEDGKFIARSITELQIFIQDLMINADDNNEVYNQFLSEINKISEKFNELCSQLSEIKETEEVNQNGNS